MSETNDKVAPDQEPRSSATVAALSDMMNDAALLADANLKTRFALISVGSMFVGAAIFMLVSESRRRGWL